MDSNNIKIPNHVGIIMDGNGRWAQQRNLSRSMGHKKGSETLEKLTKYIFKKGVKVLSVFAFSTENFKRSKEEVDYLMNLFVKKFNSEFKMYQKENIKVVFSGREFPLKQEVIDTMKNITEKTKNNTGGIFNICLNYGGQAEIVDASKKIANDILNNKISKEAINEELFAKYLYNDLPPIDLLIRTSGEERISNFMLWQAAYSEFYFTKTLFPDFNTEELDKAIMEYSKRNRRFGGINNGN